jgi:hypothetical protein
MTTLFLNKPNKHRDGKSKNQAASNSFRTSEHRNGLLQHPILVLEKELVKEVGKELRHLQKNNPCSQNDNI